MYNEQQPIIVGLDIGTTKIAAIAGRKNEFGKLESWPKVLSLSFENNFPNWYSSCLLFCTAVLIAWNCADVKAATLSVVSPIKAPVGMDLKSCVCIDGTCAVVSAAICADENAAQSSVVIATMAVVDRPAIWAVLSDGIREAMFQTPQSV